MVVYCVVCVNTVLCFRYVVFLSGKKAVHEALVVKSIDFADRPEFYSQMLMNENRKG